MNSAILKRFNLNHDSAYIVANYANLIKDRKVSVDKYSEGHSNDRAKQLASADILVEELIGRGEKIIREASGQPHLEDNSYHISISHTDHFMAMLASKSRRVAIDIEVKGRKIDRIKDRFTITSEFNMVEASGIEEPLLVLWSIKECLFKVIPQDQILFKEHLTINEVQQIDGIFKFYCSVEHPKFQRTFEAFSKQEGSLILSYIIDDDK